MNDTTYFVRVIKYVIWIATNGEIYSRWGTTCCLSAELCECWNPSVRCWKGNCSPNIIFQQREKGLFGHKLTKTMRMIVCVSRVKNRKATWWRFPAGKKKTLFFNQTDVVSLYYTVRANSCLLLSTPKIAPDGWDVGISLYIFFLSHSISWGYN